MVENGYRKLLASVAAMAVGLAGCGGSGEEDAAASNAAASASGTSAAAAPVVTIAAGPDICFRKVADKFGTDIKVTEITSYFSAGREIDGMATAPRGEMTTCSVTFQDPSDPRKLQTALFDRRTGAFGAPKPVEISVMGGNAADFRVDDYLIPLSSVDTAPLAALMEAQKERLAKTYGDFAWTGTRLSAPSAFSNTHKLRFDVAGKLAVNDVKEDGYAEVSLDGKTITSDDLLPR